MNNKLNVLRLALLSLTAIAIAGAAETKIALKLTAEGLVSPTTLVPIDQGRILIADQLGKIHLLKPDGKLSDQLVLDLTGKLSKHNTNAFDERGLVGLAVHPGFAGNHRLYAFYSAPLRESAPTNFDHTARISEFIVGPDGRAAQERVLLEMDMPYFNHHGGRMAFGPDGLLYIGVGDGGNANDVGRGHSPQGNGQDTSKLLGKVLRIDVNNRDAGQQYAVPKDNPFVKGGGAAEIFAYGLRNPWGLSFDRGGSRELFLADVGQDSYEEIDIIKKGGNYGWSLREGFVCFDPKAPKNPPEDCPKVGANGEPLIDPIIAYKNSNKFSKDKDAKGISVTGGYVYRGKALPQLAGKYVFADWSRGRAKPDGVLYVGTKGADGQWTMELLETTVPLASHIVGLGEDADGELYVLSNPTSLLKGTNGKVWKLVAE